jgi:hypothetical protein
VQPLEARTLLSQAGVPSSASAQAELASIAGAVGTTTILQADTQASVRRPTVTLTATVTAPAISRPVGVGAVRFSVVSPTRQDLGVATPNSRGVATLTTARLTHGATYVIEAQYATPTGSFASSDAQLDVSVGQSPVRSFRITAPQYYGSPGTPITFSVTAVNRAHQTVTDFTGSIAFVSPTDHSAKFISRSYTFTPSDQGTHQFFAGVTFHKGGAEVVKVHQANNTHVSGSQPFGIQ